MNISTIQRLNAINQQFYATVADAFDTTRGKPWPGWLRLAPHLQRLVRERGGEGLRVLDVGCGNGRFGVFVAGNLTPASLSLSINGEGTGVRLFYHGLDSNLALLDHARAALAPFPALTVRLEERDIIAAPPDAGEYDLVALFGVMHHLPGAETRLALVRALAARAAPGGLLAFACWRFMEYTRFRERIAPWPDDLAGEVEPGDALLDWREGANALRYCHYVDDAEHAALVASAGLDVVDDYRADGVTRDANRYTVLRKPDHEDTKKDEQRLNKT